MRHLESCSRYVLVVALILSLSFHLGQPVAGASGLDELEDPELQMLSGLFHLLLTVEGARERMDEIDGQIAGIEDEIASLQSIIREGEDKYLKARDRTITSLRWIHRLGPASYLEILLGATSLRDFLRKTEIVGAAARGAVTALADIQREKRSLDELEGEIGALTLQLEDLREEREPLATAEANLQQERDRLAGVFGEQWEPLYAELSSLTIPWEEDVLPYLSGLPSRLARLAERGVAPGDITIIPGVFSFRALIPSSSLNAMMRGEPGLKGAVFDFSPDEVNLIIDGIETVITGTLSLDDRGLVLYEVSGLSFAGLPIRDSGALDLLDEMHLDLGSALQGMRPRSLSVGDGVLELVVTLLP
ncbi:MAG: hypothetical protein R6U70_01025 [Bacillota bacterium]